jgi:hypothetical protein
MRASRTAGLLFATVLLVIPVDASAQSCAGDCDGDGTVTVSEIITAVNIVLGNTPLAACAAIVPNGSGPPGVSHLIAAVGSAQCQCQACPTPPPPRTPTATSLPPTATATITQTPTATPLVSHWVEHTLTLRGSTCSKHIHDSIRAQALGQSESYRISERDGMATVEDSAGNVDVATVDAAGVLHDTVSDSDSQGSCTVFVDVAISVSLRSAQSTATYKYNVTSSGCPRQVQCHLTIMSRWRRTDVSP